VGHTLDELKNEITKTTPASFEPTIDYVVTKIPRFTFEKFSTSPVILGTSMKSVGEVMAIGRNFKESLQKALVSLEIGFSGLDRIFELNKNQIEKKLKENIPNKILLIAEAFRKKINIKKIQRLSKIDNWFLEQIKEIVDTENEIIKIGLPKNYVEFNRIKSIGFSDKKLSQLTKIPEMIVRKKRTALKVIPVFKKVDTCAAEFKSFTPYMYSTYQRNFSIKSECEANPSSKRKIIILGGGPNRIGQGIEFDYCCCQASFALREVDIETIMINCNPETVSTDFDTSDRLYFEPLTLEDVLAIVEVENPSGVIVQFGGQTPLNLAAALAKAGVPIIGTSPDAIDQAEDRERFQQMIHKLGLLQPANRIIRNIDEGLAAAEEIGYPLVVRPSYVLGGRQVDSQSLLLLLILHQYF
jgi:carbamoyl-phosphate synthase large subunit